MENDHICSSEDCENVLDFDDNTSNNEGVPTGGDECFICKQHFCSECLQYDDGLHSSLCSSCVIWMEDRLSKG